MPDSVLRPAPVSARTALPRARSQRISAGLTQKELARPATKARGGPSERLDSTMQGKTVLVTGANQGIGKATAIALAQKGANVVIVARNGEKGRAALGEVKAASTGGKAELIVADLSSQEQVRRAAAEFKAGHDRLHVLVNNAGIYVPERHTTVDGLEETFALNHLGYFLLTRELLDVLKRTAPARIVNVSSEAHRVAAMQWDDLQSDTHRYRAFKAYGQSKLANVLFTYELARQLEGTGVTANALHPGVIGSGFGQTYGSALSVLEEDRAPLHAHARG